MSRMMMNVVSMRMEWVGTGVSMLMMSETEFKMYKVMMSLAPAVQKV